MPAMRARSKPISPAARPARRVRANARCSACSPTPICAMPRRRACARVSRPRCRSRSAAAEPPLRAARLCDGLGGLGARRLRRRRRGAAPGRPAAHPFGSRLRASALAPGRPSHRRGLHRPAHGEAVVQRQARRRPARDRPHRARFYAGRRPARLYRRARHRRGRLQAPAARDQFVRVADLEHANIARRRPRPCRASTAAAGAIAA